VTAIVVCTIQQHATATNFDLRSPLRSYYKPAGHGLAIRTQSRPLLRCTLLWSGLLCLGRLKEQPIVGGHAADLCSAAVCINYAF